MLALPGDIPCLSRPNINIFMTLFFYYGSSIMKLYFLNHRGAAKTYQSVYTLHFLANNIFSTVLRRFKKLAFLSLARNYNYSFEITKQTQFAISCYRTLILPIGTTTLAQSHLLSTKMKFELLF